MDDCPPPRAEMFAAGSRCATAGDKRETKRWSVTNITFFCSFIWRRILATSSSGRRAATKPELFPSACSAF